MKFAKWIDASKWHLASAATKRGWSSIKMTTRTGASPLSTRIKLCKSRPKCQQNLANHFHWSALNYRAQVQHGDSIVVIFNVRPLSTIDKDYSVFVHLVDKDGHLIAGTDQLLLKKENPTSRWRANESIAQGIIVPIDASISPGDYELGIGVYYLPTLERLPVMDDHGTPTDQVVIKPFTIQ